MSNYTLEQAKKDARRIWGRSTPFRVGICMGAHFGLDAKNPYVGTKRAFGGFQNGVEYGASRREQHLKLLTDIGDETC